MKQKLFLSTILMMISSIMFPVKTLEGKFALPPGYSFATLNATTGKIVTKLEPATAVYQKPKGRVTSATYAVSGIKSSVRLKISDVLFQLLADQSAGTLNPTYYVSLFKLETGKSSRILTVNADGSSNSLIPVKITQTYELTYKIEVMAAILPGEYAFIDKTTTTSEGNVTVWTFGID